MQSILRDGLNAGLQHTKGPGGPLPISLVPASLCSSASFFAAPTAWPSLFPSAQVGESPASPPRALGTWLLALTDLVTLGGDGVCVVWAQGLGREGAGGGRA